MHWTDWLLIVIGGGLMVITLAAACGMLNWMLAMMMAITTVR